MTNIQVSVTGAELTARVEGKLTGGAVGLPVSFTFDSTWEGLTKTAVFRAGGLTVDRVDVQGETTVPWEIMEKENCMLRLGVYGANEDGTLVIPTAWAEVGTILPGADPSGDESADPSLPVWQQVLNAVKEGLATLAAKIIGAKGTGANAEVFNDTTGNKASGSYSHAEGAKSTASGAYSHAEGFSARASGSYSHSEGYATTAEGDYSHAEGKETAATGNYAHAEGEATTASGNHSHAEGSKTTASGSRSHAEGGSTSASAAYSHAEGYGASAEAAAAHVEGSQTTAAGEAAHAEGLKTQANGRYSHTEGRITIAGSPFQHVQGNCNIVDSDNKYAHIVGNGTSDTDRSNAHTLDWDGNAWFAGAVECTALLLLSPNGTRYRITVSDSGVLTTTKITN